MDQSGLVFNYFLFKKMYSLLHPPSPTSQLTLVFMDTKNETIPHCRDTTSLYVSMYGFILSVIFAMVSGVTQCCWQTTVLHPPHFLPPPSLFPPHPPCSLPPSLFPPTLPTLPVPSLQLYMSIFMLYLTKLYARWNLPCKCVTHPPHYSHSHPHTSLNPHPPHTPPPHSPHNIHVPLPHTQPRSHSIATRSS